MKGGVTCLGGMFSRRNKVKGAIIDDAVVAKKGIHEDIVTDGTSKEYSESFSVKETSISLHGVHALRRSPAGGGGVHGLSQEVPSCVDPSVESVPSTTVPAEPQDSENVATDVTYSSLACEPMTTGSSSVDMETSSLKPLTQCDSSSTDVDSAKMSVMRSVYANGILGDAEYEDDEEDDVTRAGGGGQRGVSRDDPLLFDDGRNKPARIEDDYSPPQSKLMDSDSARYYDEFSASAGYGSIRRDGNAYQDIDMGSGHVSDPGVYSKDLESAYNSPIRNGCEAADNKIHEGLVLSEAARDCSEFELRARNQDTVSIISGPNTAVLSYDSGSSTTGEVRYGAFVTVGGSPKSESAYQYNGDHAMFNYGASSGVLEAQKRKPWWKVFLVSHRNIHREPPVAGALGTLTEGETARSSSPVNGYVSDVEDRSGRSSPSTKNGDVSGGSGRKLEKAGSLLRSSYSEQDLHRQASEETQAQESADGCEAIVAGPHPFWNGREVLSERNKPSMTARKWDTFTEKAGLSRVEEWVSNVPLAPALDEDQFEPQAEIAPDSPSAPAAAFFSPFEENSPYSDQEEKNGAVRADGVFDAEQEMARMVARSVNPLSTVAHFSGVGLKVLPSLAIYTSLKTLNLSANNIVRITPGSLPKSLHTLDLSRNQIVMIEGLRELTRLRALNLSFNRITRIGNGLSSCMSLKELYLAGNKISEVEGLHRLSKLSVLDLSFNKLTTTKSLGQIAANYKSLQALNLLGNAVQSNLGDDHMRRFVTGVCPQVLYLNKQPLKAVSNRDAVDNNVARAALGKSSGGKAATKASKRAAAHSSTSNHRRSHSGGGGGKSKAASKGVVSPVLVPESGHHRKSHHSSRPQDKASASKEIRKPFVPLPESAYPPLTDRKGRSSERSEISGIPRVRSDDSFFRERRNSILSPHLSGELVEAH